MGTINEGWIYGQLLIYTGYMCRASGEQYYTCRGNKQGTNSGPPCHWTNRQLSCQGVNSWVRERAGRRDLVLDIHERTWICRTVHHCNTLAIGLLVNKKCIQIHGSSSVQYLFPDQMVTLASTSSKTYFTLTNVVQYYFKCSIEHGRTTIILRLNYYITLCAFRKPPQ